MKYFAGCLTSAILGGAVALWLAEQRPWEGRPVHAQDDSRGVPRGKAIPPAGRGSVKEAAARGKSHGPVPHPPAEAELPYDQGGLTAEERVNVAVYEAVNRSVVHITIKGAREAGLFMLEVPTEGSGSGSILDHAGHILTNNHVIDVARQVNVTLFDGSSHEARFVGSDPVNDIAVIRIDAPAELLHPVELGDSGNLRVGMRVFAIGNPFGLERTLTTGIISSLNRTLQVHETRTIRSIIQIDAAINPGNSGGPLLDAHGRLIGINTAIASKTGQSAGVGFAIPVNTVARVVPQLIANGRVVRPEIGISKVYETEQGLLVYRLVPDGPAERAGLQGPQVVRRRKGPFLIETEDKSAADLIVGIDDEKVATADDFLAQIESRHPGDRVVLKVIRQSQELRIPVVLGGHDDAGGRPRR